MFPQDFSYILPILRDIESNIHIKTSAKHSYEANLKPDFPIIDSMGIDTLEIYKGLVDDAFRDTPFNLRQSKAGEILSEAHKHLTREEFKEIEKYAFEKLE